MPDTFTVEQRSDIMRRVRSEQTSPELRLRLEFRKQHITGFRAHDDRLPGHPDFAFRSGQVAIFVDGCFWHGCPKCYRRPGSNRAYWDDKVARNIQRAGVVNRTLRDRGWTVLRLWEHELRDMPSVLRRVCRALDGRRG
jgi:DNA mismatch endonuclease (patch repair protein)